MKIETSIFLTCYDRPEHTKKCLPAIKEQCDDSVEIILCDDYHIHHPERKAFCDSLGVRYIHTGKQKQGKNMWRDAGFALNIGFKQSSGKNIIFGNSEILIDKNTIASMIELIESGYICSPRIFAEGFNKLFDNTLPFFLGMPRSIFSDIGGFDEDMTGYCFNDNDLSDRSREVGEFKEIKNITALHLFNQIGTEARKDTFVTQEAWIANQTMYKERKTILVRNKDREWGQLDKEYVR